MNIADMLQLKSSEAFFGDGRFGVRLLEEILNTPTVSGIQERLLIEKLRSILAGLGCKNEMIGDCLVAVKEGNQDGSVLIDVHVDTVGFAVNHIGDGVVHVMPMGGITPSAAVTNYVTIHTRNGQVPGIIGYTPPHLKGSGGDDKKAVEQGDLFVIPQGTDEQNNAIGVGDPVEIVSPFSLTDTWIRGLGVDDGIGVWQVLNLLAMTADSTATYPTIIVSFSTQEEVGAHGTERVLPGIIQKYEPDIAIVLDCTSSTAIPGVKKELAGDIGLDGPAITFRDHGTVYDRQLTDFVLCVARQLGIRHYPRMTQFGGTDGMKLTQVAGGRRTVSISTPSLNIHSMSASVKKKATYLTLLLLAGLLFHKETWLGFYGIATS